MGNCCQSDDTVNKVLKYHQNEVKSEKKENIFPPNHNLSEINIKSEIKDFKNWLNKNKPKNEFVNYKNDKINASFCTISRFAEEKDEPLLRRATDNFGEYYENRFFKLDKNNEKIILKKQQIRELKPKYRNFAGPTVMRAPDWLQPKLGKYYLYFANHDKDFGQYIRLAVSDDIKGPYSVLKGGVLNVKDFPKDESFEDEIGSPQVKIDDKNKKILIFFHCPHKNHSKELQFSGLAVSNDGLKFELKEHIISYPYIKVFEKNNKYYALGRWFDNANLGGYQLLQSHSGLYGPYGNNQNRFSMNHGRHLAVYVKGDLLYIFWSQRGDTPESIMLTVFDISDSDYKKWDIHPKFKENYGTKVTVMVPSTFWEGVDEPLKPSKGGASHKKVRQLRDPEIFVDNDGKIYMFYTCAGEYGIAAAEITIKDNPFS